MRVAVNHRFIPARHPPAQPFAKRIVITKTTSPMVVGNHEQRYRHIERSENAAARLKGER